MDNKNPSQASYSRTMQFFREHKPCPPFVLPKPELSTITEGKIFSKVKGLS